MPFFTTKAGGSGIGPVLSRRIAEAHGGSLTVENHKPQQSLTKSGRVDFRGGLREAAARQ